MAWAGPCACLDQGSGWGLGAFGPGADPGYTWRHHTRPVGSAPRAGLRKLRTAGKLALQGTPGSAWDPAAHAAAEHTSFTPDAGYNGDYYGFFYPPSFLLICVPLALLPYGIAVAAWLATTGAAYFATIRALLPPRWPALLVAVAYPAVLLNTAHGQNGALFTTLLGLAALQLERRPWLAGACLGALSIKPHLALLVVPALFAARRWRALAWAVVVTATLFLVSLLVVHEAV